MRLIIPLSALSLIACMAAWASDAIPDAGRTAGSQPVAKRDSGAVHPFAPAVKIHPAPGTAAAAAADAGAHGAGRPLSDSTLSAPAAPDSSSPDTMALAGNASPRKLYEYISYPLLQAVTWPLEHVVAPTVKTLIYPAKPPLRYFLNENVIDRTIQLISFGEKDRIMIYPTMNLAPGTGSSVGTTLRYNSLFGRPTERLVAQGNIFVNGDFKLRSYVTVADILGTGFNSKLVVALARVKNTSVNQPGTASFWYYADSSNSYSANLSHLLFEKLSLKGGFIYRDNHFGNAPVQPDSLSGDFFRNAAGDMDTASRGLNRSWADRIITAGLARDTRTNMNIPLAGSDFSASYHYHLTTDHHDFHGWETSLTNYFKLGKEKFEISRDEERKAGDISLGKMLKKMELENLRKELFNRKVLVTHIYTAQVYELSGNRMPVYGLQTLGNDTPMRGYGGSRFRDYTVVSAGAEYRFPFLRLVDGVVFNEYGIYGRSWDKIDVLDNIKNSWGFGIRVRRPDIYLFRLQLGFHGREGIQLNMSVDEPY
ncbi:MAG: hypothetical protein ABI036_10415 [Fibrobacteria bacterium]